MSSDYICLYTGYGTSPTFYDATAASLIKALGTDGKRRVICIDHLGDFIDKCLQPGNTLIIPDGEASLIRDKFLEFNVQKVKNFIQEGKGAYIGFGAGSYIAGPSSLEVNLFKFTQTFNHEFFTSEKIDLLEVKKPIQAVDIFDPKMKRTLKTICWLGGAYEVINPGEVVAFYESQSSMKVAVLKPQNNVLLFNIHPEFQISEKFHDLYLSEDEISSLSNKDMMLDWFKNTLNLIGIEEAKIEKNDFHQTTLETESFFHCANNAIPFYSEITDNISKNQKVTLLVQSVLQKMPKLPRGVGCITQAELSKK